MYAAHTCAPRFRHSSTAAGTQSGVGRRPARSRPLPHTTTVIERTIAAAAAAAMASELQQVSPIITVTRARKLFNNYRDHTRTVPEIRPSVQIRFSKTSRNRPSGPSGGTRTKRVIFAEYKTDFRSGSMNTKRDLIIGEFVYRHFVLLLDNFS